MLYCKINPRILTARAMGRVGVLALWCLLAVGSTAIEAFGQYRFDSWSTDQGLPHNNIHGLLQTRDGYLWMTTTDGLVRFDGIRFTIFDTAGGRGFSSNRCTALCEDRQGDLWIGTEDSGVMRYRGGWFTKYTIADGLPRNDVRRIGETVSGDLIVTTYSGAAHWRDGRFVPYLEDDKSVSYPNVSVDRSGGIWYGVGGSTVQRATPEGTTVYPLDPRLPRAQFGAAFQDRDGAFWVDTQEFGISRARRGLYYIRDGKTTVYTLKDGLSATAVKCFCEDRDGALWMGAWNSGLLRFRDGKFTQYTTADGLSSNQINAIYEDREGSIWVGTADGGLDRVSRQIIMTYSKANGLAADNTYPVYEDESGVVWIGGWGGLTKIENGRFTHYGQRDGLIGQHMSLLMDREGALWIGGFGALTRMRDGRFELMAGPNAKKIDLPDPATVAIYQDRQGAMWFGTIEGLVRYKDGAATVYTTSGGLPDNHIEAIHESRDGTLWIGTRGGLARFAGGGFISYTDSNGMPAVQVRCLYEDDDGVLWIGTYDSGLVRMKDGQFTRYTIKDGLFNNGAFQILEDRRGNLWMSSNKGIYSVGKQELNDFAAGKIHSLTSISFDKKDGMLDQECNGGMQPAGCKTRDGKMWFPTQHGVAIIDPEAVPRNPLPPPVLIEEFLIQRQPAALRDVMEIAPGKDDFELDYTGLSFIKSESVKFKYQMVGLDHDWIDAGTRRSVYYSHLPPGNYTFRVTAANSDGLWNTEGSSIRIRILPPFYRTWWFVALAATALGALALLVYRQRVSRLERARAAQEAFSRRLIDSQEQERKRIAAELHDSLGQDLLIIKNRALLGQMTAREGEDATYQFDEINDTVSRAIDEVRAISYNLRPHHLDRLGLTKALEAMIENVAAASTIGFTWRIADLEGVLSKSSEINLYRIVQEGVNNIIRHSGAAEAEIDVNRDAHGVLVLIRDNGRGFVADALPAEEGRGFGLTSISERVRMISGALVLQSSPGQGTTITIKLPLRDS
jgi:signal transduction histidine kinase/ligand-binding sensor domain-containing protein